MKVISSKIEDSQLILIFKIQFEIEPKKMCSIEMYGILQNGDIKEDSITPSFEDEEEFNSLPEKLQNELKEVTKKALQEREEYFENWY